MKKIDININQAKILGYSVDLESEKLESTATIGLFTGDKKISTFSLRTQECFGDSIEFDLPVKLIEPIQDVAKELEVVLVRECNKSLKRLEAPKNK